MLKKATITQPAFTTTLNDAIGAITIANALDDEARYDALEGLKHYLSLPGISGLDFKAWGSYEFLSRDVAQQVVEVERMMDLNSPVSLVL